MYRITYVHKGETKENELYTAGDQEYCLAYAKLSLECGQSGELEIDVPLTNPARNEIICLTDEIIVYRHDEEIWRGRPVTMQIDFNMTGTLLCEGILSYLYDTYMPPYDFQGSPKEFVQMVLDNHNEQVEELKQFTLGDVTVEDNNDYITRSSIYYSGRSLEVLTDKLVKESLGGFFRVRIKDGVRYLDYLKDYNTQASQAIEFGVNLLDIAQDIEYGTVASVLLPIGARIEDEEGHETDERVTIESVNGGSKYIVDESAVERYGWIVTEMEWDDVTLPENLLTKGTDALTQLTSAVTSLTVTAVDLSLTDEQIESINLGDLTYIHSVPHNVNQYIELTAVNMDLLAPQNDILTFGATSATLTGSTRSTEADVKSAIGSLSQRLTSVSAVYGDFTLLTAQVANIENVLAGNVGTGDLQTIVITTDNAYIDSAVIMDALIGTVLADIIQSNIIYTDEITIMSENGGIILAGTTMQFCDENGTVRLQLGQDASGNFTFVLYDETGTGIMIDSEGIHESAIPDGLIVDDMVSEDANISASKINMAEVTDYLNESGDLVLQAYQVTIDGETLDYKLTQMTQQIEELSLDGIDYIECLYALGSEDEPPCEPWEEISNSVLGEFILGETKLGCIGWTTERLVADEGEYLWWCLRYVYVDGTVAYTTPCLWTDSYVRSALAIQQTELSVVQGQIQAKVWESDITEAISPLEGQITTISDQYGILTVLVDTIDERVGTLTTTENEHYLEMSSQVNDITINLEGISLEVEEVYQKTANAIVEGTPYYAVSERPDWYPPHEADGNTSILGEMVLGEAILGFGGDEWTTEQPEAEEGQYIWISYLRERVDGSTYWTEPTLLTDEWARLAEQELSQRYSELVLTVDSAVLEVANIQTNLELNYSTTTVTEAIIAEYVDESMGQISISVTSYSDYYINFTDYNCAHYDGWEEYQWNSGEGSLSKVYFDEIGEYAYDIYQTSDSGYYGMRYKISDTTKKGTIKFSFKFMSDTALAVGYGFRYNDTDHLMYVNGYSVNEWHYENENTSRNIEEEGSSPMYIYFRVRTRGANIHVYITEIQVEFSDNSAENGSLGSYAGITLTAGGSSTNGVLDLTNVRQAFADDESTITIAAGTISFISNTFICESTYFKVTAEGDITATSGTIGGWTIGSSSLYNGTSSTTSTTNGTYIGTNGIRQYNSGDYLNITSSNIQNGNSDNDYCYMTSATIRFYQEGTQVGRYACNEWVDVSGTKGLTIGLEYGSDFIALGRKSSSSATTYTSAYYISYNTSISSYRHNFSGTAYFGGYIYANTYLYFLNSSGTDRYLNNWYSSYLGTTGIYCSGDFATNGNLLVGNISYGTSYKLHVYGSAYASGGWAGTSDETLKDDINPLSTNTETFLDKLTPISFKFKDDEKGKTHFGVTYQNVCEALEAEGIDPAESGLVGTMSKDGGEEKGVLYYDELIAPLIYEVKQLKAEIAELKKQKASQS